MNESETIAVPHLAPVHNAQAWRGHDMARRRDWIHVFSREEVKELDRAVSLADQPTGRDILQIQRKDFPLPRLATVLERVRREVLHGRGFYLFRGLPVERYSIRQSAIAYWGLSLYLGDEALSQNGKGHVMGHIVNLGLDYSDPDTRGYQTSARLNYHCDYSDIVGLLSLRSSKSGGLSSIVSSTTIWNELLQRRPDLARALTQPLYYTRWGEIPEGKLHYDAVPMFCSYRGRVIATYVRSAINKAQALAGVPPLTAQQIEGMDLVDALAADPQLHLEMEFKPGDIQLLCNFSTFHSRTSFEDWPELEKRRHLLRIWLACKDGPPLPQFMLERTGATATGRPDGIKVPGVPLVASLEPT
ncbi:MAG: TauD/TfdA family dioxygenase [Lautropia sp.]